MVNELPFKEKKLKIKNRWFNYLVIEHHNKIYVRKRTENDIWKNLHEFALIETSGEASLKQVLYKAEEMGLLKKNSYKVLSAPAILSQQLTHQKIAGRFIRIAITKEMSIRGYKVISIKQLNQYAFPRIINSWLEEDYSPKRLKNFIFTDKKN